MYKKSAIFSAIAALCLNPFPSVSDTEVLARLRAMPYHDRSKGKGRSRPGVNFKGSTNKFKTHQGPKERARRIRQIERGVICASSVSA